MTTLLPDRLMTAEPTLTGAVSVQSSPEHSVSTHGPATPSRWTRVFVPSGHRSPSSTCRPHTLTTTVGLEPSTLVPAPSLPVTLMRWLDLTLKGPIKDITGHRNVDSPRFLMGRRLPLSVPASQAQAAVLPAGSRLAPYPGSSMRWVRVCHRVGVGGHTGFPRAAFFLVSIQAGPVSACVHTVPCRVSTGRARGHTAAFPLDCGSEDPRPPQDTERPQSQTRSSGLSSAPDPSGSTATARSYS